MPHAQTRSSETTQFSPATEVSLYLEGISKSTTRGGEKVTVQIQLNGQWLDADAVRLKVVEAEFDVQIKFWIREQWIDVPFHPLPSDVLSLTPGKRIDLRPQGGSLSQECFKIETTTGVIVYNMHFAQ